MFVPMHCIEPQQEMMILPPSVSNASDVCIHLEPRNFPIQIIRYRTIIITGRSYNFTPMNTLTHMLHRNPNAKAKTRDPKSATLFESSQCASPQSITDKKHHVCSCSTIICSEKRLLRNLQGYSVGIEIVLVG